MSRKSTLGNVLLLTVACAACSNSDSSGPLADPFVGNWACSDELSIVFSSPAGFPAQMSTQMSTLTITGSGGSLTASKVSDGGSNCSVAFKSSGSSATLSDGQTCTTKEGITLTYQSGSATVNGSSMNSSFSFDASGTVNAGGMMVPAMASGTQASTCSRLSPPPGGGTTGGW